MREESSESSKSPALVFILATLTLDGITVGLIAPVMPALLAELNGESISRAAVIGGWLQVMFCTLQFFTAPVLGNLSDSFGRRPILLASLAGLGISYVLLGFAPATIWLFVGTIFSGMFSATYSTASAYIADVSAPGDRARRLGWVAAAFGLGVILGPVLGGTLGDHGTRVPFFAAAALALSNVTFGFLIVPESLGAENRRPFSFAQANPFGAFRMIRKQTAFLRLFIALGFLHITGSTVPLIWGFITTLKFGWSPADIGVSISLRVIGTVFAQAVLLSYFTRWLGNQLTACAGFIFLIIGLFGYAFAGREWILLASIVPSSMGLMTGPALISHMSCHTPPDRQGELQGTIGCIGSVGNILTPLVMVELFSRFSQKDASIYFPGAPFLLAALLASCGLLLVIQACRSSELPHSRAATRIQG